MKYHVFLSYSRKDTTLVERINQDLQAEGLNVWIDQTGIRVGEPSWKLAIQRAIDNANCMVVIFSPEAKESHWVGQEMSYAELHKKKIFAVLVRGEETTAVPFGYGDVQRIDMRDAANYGTALEQLKNTICEHIGIDLKVLQQEKERLTAELAEKRRIEEEEREKKAKEEAERWATEQAQRLAEEEARRRAEEQSRAPAVSTFRSPATAAPRSQGQPFHQIGAIANPGARAISWMIDNILIIIGAFILNPFFGEIKSSLTGVIVLAILGGYFLFFWSQRNGQTPGKMVTGTRIVRLDGQPMDLGTAVVRFIGYLGGSSVLGLGFIWVLIDKRHRAWHDLVAGTIVVKAK